MDYPLPKERVRFRRPKKRGEGFIYFEDEELQKKTTLDKIEDDMMIVEFLVNPEKPIRTLSGKLAKFEESKS